MVTEYNLKEKNRLSPRGVNPYPLELIPIDRETKQKMV